MKEYRKAADSLAPSNVPPCLDGISLLQAAWGLELPRDYYEFLWLTNGGCFRKHVILIPDLSRRESPGLYSVKDLYPFSSYNKLSLLDLLGGEKFGSFEEQSFLPIGSSRSDATIGMSLQQKDFGAIFFLWEDFNEDVTELVRNPEFVASNFTTFWDSLVYDPNGEKFYEYPFSAAEFGDLNELKSIITNSHFKELHADDGATLLEIAVRKGQCKALELLLRAGADPNSRCSYEPVKGRPILIEALEARVEEIIRLLLAFGADPNVKSLNGNPAIVICCDHIPNIAILRMLLNAGADPHARGADGRSCVEVMTVFEGWQISPRRYALRLLGVE